MVLSAFLLTIVRQAVAIPVFNLGFLGPLTFLEGRFYSNLWAAQQALMDFESNDAPLPCASNGTQCNTRFSVRLLAADDSVMGFPSSDLARQGALNLMLGNTLQKFDFEPVVGLLGGQVPINCPASVEIGAVLKVPQIAWGCAMDIGVKGQYPYFARTHQMDFPIAFSKLTKLMAWDRFTIAWEPQESFSAINSKAIEDTILADSASVTITRAELRPRQDGKANDDNTKHDYVDWQARLTAAMSMRNNIWFAALDGETSNKLFPKLVQWDILQPWMQFVVSGSMKMGIIGQLNQGNMKLLGALVIRPLSYHKATDNHMAKQIFDRIAANGKDKFRLSEKAFIIDMATGGKLDPIDYALGSKIFGKNKGGMSHVDKLFKQAANGQLGGEYAVNHVWTLVYDAVYTFIYAINDLLAAGTPEAEIKGAFLRDAVQSQKFVGVSKSVEFVDGKRPGDWGIDNFLPKNDPSKKGGGWLAPMVGSLQNMSLVWNEKSTIQFMNGDKWKSGSADHSTLPISRMPRCPDGETRNTTGSCVKCPAGSYANATTWDGLADPAREECTPCPAAHFSASRGSSQCSFCPAGSSSVKGTTCELCAPGKMFDPLVGCRNCQAGFYQPAHGQKGCIVCGVGTFAEVGGMSECSVCELGFFNDEVQQVLCKRCQPGFFTASTAAGACTPCRRGWFNDQQGSPACEKCPRGQTTRDIGAHDRSECGCDDGQYMAGGDVAGTCKACPIGMSCGGFRAMPLVLKGYYVESTVDRFIDSLQDHVWQCVLESRCPGQSVDTDDVCKSHAAGQNCALCVFGYYRDGDDCKECAGSAALMPLCFVIFFIAMGLLHYYWNYQSGEVEAVETSATSVTVGVIITFVLQVGVLQQLNLRMPDDLSRILSFAMIFTLDLGILRPECLYAQSLTSSYLSSQMLLPVVVITFMGCGLISFVFNVATKQRIRDMVFNSSGMVIHMLFISIVTAVAKIFECFEGPNGRAVLRGFEYSICWTSEHLTIIPLGVVAGLLFVVIPFTLIVWLTANAPRKFFDPGFRLRTKFLTFKYRAASFWYGTVTLVRAMFLGSVPLLAPSNRYVQYFGMLAICVLSLIVHVSVLPYSDRYANILETFELACIMLVINLCVWFLEERDLNGADRAMARGLSYIITAAVGQCIIVLLSACAFALYLARRPDVALRWHKTQVVKLQARLLVTCGLVQQTSSEELTRLLSTVSYVDRHFMQEVINVFELEVGNTHSRHWSEIRLPMITTTASRRISMTEAEASWAIEPMVSNNEDPPVSVSGGAGLNLEQAIERTGSNDEESGRRGISL